MQALELRARAHVKLGNADKAIEDLQKFLSLEANYNEYTEEEKTSTELEASGENPIQSALSDDDDSDDEAIISSDEEEHAHALQNIAHPPREKRPGSSNDCSNMSDSNQNYKKLERTMRGLKKLRMKKNLDYVEKNNGTVERSSSTKICLTGVKTKHASVMSEQLQKGRNTHTKRAKKVKEGHIKSGRKEIAQPEKWMNSYKIPKVEKPAKLGHPPPPNFGKWDQEMTKMQRDKVVSKTISSQATATSNGEKMRGAPQLKGILRKKGHHCKKAKAVRWQIPLHKVIWISRNRNFQESWHVSFAKKISVSKSTV